MPKKSLATKLPDELLDNEEEDAEMLFGGYVRRKIDPIHAHRAMVKQAELDGDPRFDFALSTETVQRHPDKDFQWITEADVRLFTGRSRGYSVIKGKDNVELANGTKYDPDETIIVDDLILVWGSMEKKLAREERERRTNRESRKSILKKNMNQQIIYVGPQ